MSNKFKILFHNFVFINIIVVLLSQINTTYPKIAIKKIPKTLILIIASDADPIYIALQKVWRTYMHTDPEHFEAYFIKADPNLPVKYKIDGDIIWSQSVESLEPGILNKTILSLECMLPRIKSGEFDYILRTNLSSFYILPGLLSYLKTCPTQRFYGGSSACGFIYKRGHKYHAGSGSGFLLSSDMAQLLAENKHNLIDDISMADDVAIGHFFEINKIKLKQHPRLDFYTKTDFLQKHHKITSKNFQIRVKNNQHRLRISDDIYIYNELLSKFYNKKLIL